MRLKEGYFFSNKSYGGYGKRWHIVKDTKRYGWITVCGGLAPIDYTRETEAEQDESLVCKNCLREYRRMP